MITLPLKATNMPINPKIRAWNVLLLLKNYCYCPFLALLLLLLTIAKGLPELLLLLLISDLPELLLLLLIEKFSIDQLWIVDLCLMSYGSFFLSYTVWNKLTWYQTLPPNCAAWRIFDIKMTKFVIFFLLIFFTIMPRRYDYFFWCDKNCHFA